LNRPITTGDRLWADAGGRAEMHVGSLAVRMDEQTSLDVLKLDDRGLQLRLAQGSASLRVRRGDLPLEVATPGGAVVLTRPGAYRVSVDPRGSATSVTVRAGGQAEVFAPNGSPGEGWPAGDDRGCPPGSRRCVGAR
jgi:ferric-dicitrate binding protein FerR (iron transport regulator)